MSHRAVRRLGEVGLTFVLFSLFNLVAVHFEIEKGVSILFPATAVSIVCCMYFGLWGAIGVFLGAMATPWSAATAVKTLALSGVVSAIEGLIPYAVFRFRRDLLRDLRDFRSLAAFLLFGTILNTGSSAIAGNLLILDQAPGVVISWRQVSIWWIADFTSALLLALPALAFGGAFVSRMRSDQPERSRSIVNTLQIVTVTILLGFAASFAIRTLLLNRIEGERLAQQRVWGTAQETINKMHRNFLRAAFLPPVAATKVELARARAANESYIQELTPLLTGSSPQLDREFPRIADATRRWFDRMPAAIEAGEVRGATEGTAHGIGREIAKLRDLMEKANRDAWDVYAAKRKRIVSVTWMVDALVFFILVLAAATLIVNISRPFTQIGIAIRAMREGQKLDTSHIDARFDEFASIANALEETSRELRRREDELRLQTERALAASKAKSDFLAKMSHELRTPLNSIVGFTELLIEEEGTIAPSKRASFLRNVARSSRHLLKLINDLLDIAKVESGKMTIHYEDVDLRLAIANTVASTSPLFTQKKQDVEIDMPQEPMIVRGDSRRLEQVLLNLLSNANKFTPEGEKILIRSRADESRWHIDVIDRGIGISTSDQQRIFDEFEQVHERGPNSAGTGLGLALARRFVEAHGGALEVASDLGKGAIFSVRLPRA